MTSRAARKVYLAERYASCTVLDWAKTPAQRACMMIADHESLYRQIADTFNIPYWVPGILHQMESGGDFTKHLACGDPLTGDTVHVPVGIMGKYFPETKPPYDFHDAAVAALERYHDGWGSLLIPDTASALCFFDQWNGIGEWGMTTTPGCPYIFSGTDAYVRGKFASDGKWDPNAVSRQVGVAALMRAFGIA